MIDIGHIKTRVTIVDTLGYRLYDGKAEDIPRDMLDMVEELAPCHDYNRDEDYLWIEVL